jgi:hypothetical protein
MSRMNSKSQLEALRQQQLAIAQKIKDAEAKEKQKQREDNERRALLAGAAALAELQQNPDSPFAATLLARLSFSLKRPADRALFPALPLQVPEEAKPIEEPKAPAEPLPRKENEPIADYLQRMLERSLPPNRQPPESSSS